MTKKFVLVLMAVAVAAMVSACEAPAENGGVNVSNDVDINVCCGCKKPAGDVVESDVGFEFVPCTTDSDCDEDEKCNSQGVCTIPGEDGTNGKDGTNGNDGTSCTVNMNDSGCAVVTCGTVSSEPICNGENGTDGKDGQGCTVGMDYYGCAVVSCGDVYSTPICSGTNGADGISCTVNMDTNGCAVVSCGLISSDPICSGINGTNGTDGKDGISCTVGMDTNNCAIITCGTISSDPICDGQDGVPPDCDDGNSCTRDLWDTATQKCVNLSLSGYACDDGSMCTTGDECVAGVCLSGQPLDCDDGDDSTLDSCVPTSGCVNTPIEEDYECQWDADEEVCCMANGPACVIAGWVGQPTPDSDGKPLLTFTLNPGACFVPESGNANAVACSITEVSGGRLVGACNLVAGGVGITHDGLCHP